MSTPEKLKGPALLQHYAGRLRSRMGAFFPGSHAIFRGHDLHRDLKDMDWISLYLFSITGRRFSAQEVELLQAVWTYTSYPDVRLWNNRVVGLAGSARSTGNLALSGGLAVSEAAIYGRGIDIRAIDFLQRTQKAVAAGGSLEACVHDEMAQHRSIAGYGRPLISGDERIPHLLTLMEKLGWEQGPHQRLAWELDRWLQQSRWQKRINYAGIVAAIGADLGFSPREYYLYVFAGFLAGMIPVYLEAAERPEGTLYVGPCSDISYEGPVPRAWPAPPA
jgi:hypothetical protein